ncbi:MAG: hypothetical protein KKF30_12160 [Proteobacteria bacterium]|nr:hypothetical protein [Pseudomonadota bacterium]MBU4469434.1 hypothetical protein [Pseudomonadota bacterium]MCG2752335.1 hypothetical protein [Desulfobacteraceae bacterium]
MKKMLISTIVMVFSLMACTVMAMGVRGPGVDVVVSIPVLPFIVVMEQEPYYYYQGYHYHYANDRWYYSKSKKGTRKDLPRSHYAKEVKYKTDHWKYDKGRNQYYRNDNRGHDQRKDNRGHDQRNDGRSH